MAASEEADTERESALWVVVLGTALWAVAINVPPTLITPWLGELIAALGWVVLPYGLYLDIAYVRSLDREWKPTVRYWLIPALVPFVAALVGMAYLYFRLVRYRGRRGVR